MIRFETARLHKSTKNGGLFIKNSDDAPAHVPAETLLRRVMADDEKLLWAARPNVDVLLENRGQPPSRSFGRLLTLVVVIGGSFWLLTRYSGVELPTTPEDLGKLLDSKAIYPVAALIGIFILTQFIRRLGWDNDSRLERWLRAQSYGLTNRRLLILSGDSIEHELGPEDFAEPQVQDRGSGYGDVELEVKSSPSGQRTSSFQRERLRVAFRAIPNAADVKRRIDDWRSAFRREEENEARAFLDGAAATPRQAGVTGNVRTLRNDKYGVTFSLPDSWDIKVRKRRKPYGKVFLDLERWKNLDELPDWNVLKAEGDYFTAFELHLDHVRKPVMVYQQAKNSALIKALSGEIVESEQNVQRGNFEGFSITRKHVERRPDQSGTDRNRPALHRWMLLHDGRLQIGLSMIWPEDSEPLQRAIDKIVESIRVD